MRGPEAALLAYARGLMYWHRRHRFCGVCGAATDSRGGGHVRRCRNADEPHEHFPRTDPAVIMLVTHDDLEGRGPAALLGRQSRWPDGMYSTLAGFVEPGESLEEAVAREVREETGVAVADVRYQASQPWPFPSSLMLGFRARAVTTGIDVDQRELQDARSGSLSRSCSRTRPARRPPTATTMAPMHRPRARNPTKSAPPVERTGPMSRPSA